MSGKLEHLSTETALGTPEANHTSWFDDMRGAIDHYVESARHWATVGTMFTISASGEAILSPDFPNKLEAVGKFIDLASKVGITPDNFNQLLRQAAPSNLNEVALLAFGAAGLLCYGKAGYLAIKDIFGKQEEANG